MTSSITNWDLNEPDFTSPLDGSLDSIRANYHYLLMVAAHGSVVLPGWNTTVTATDYSEPDTITLTRGSQRIIFNYTWTDGSVSAIQMCMDDGVSSPGLYCFPEIGFYYDDNGNPTGTVPPPDLSTDLVAWYTLDETTGTRVNSHDPGTWDLSEIGTVTTEAGISGNAAIGDTSPDSLLAASFGAIIDTTQDWTVACWTRVVNYTLNATAWTLGLNLTTIAAVRLHTALSGSMRVTIQNNGSTGGSQATDDIFWDQASLACVVVTYDSATQTVVMTVNNSTTASLTMNANGHPDPATRLGVCGINASTGYDVSVDELAIAQRKWSAEDIAQYYNSGAGMTYTEI